MKKNDIIESEIRVDWKDRDGVKAWISVGGENDICVRETFDDEKMALAALEKYETSVSEEAYPHRHIDVTEYSILEYFVDEDGEFDEAGDFIAVTPMILTVYERETHDNLGTFDNYADAKKTMDNSEYGGYVSSGKSWI